MGWLSNIYCNVKLASLSLKQPPNDAGSEAQRKYVEEELRLIDQLLTRYPTWADGHLGRAMRIVQARYCYGRAPEPQDVAAVRVSLKAVEELSADKPEHLLAVWFGYAMALFFERKMEEALRCFQDLASREDLRILENWQVVTVFECAASCCMSLGDESSAAVFLEKIPANERSSETSNMLKMLREKSS